MTWRPSASLPVLKARAAYMQRIRDFFTSRAYLEVDTPVLTRYGITDVYLTQLATRCWGQSCYLQTSPEYPMKRLLAAGSGPIFQLARVFRDDEKGRWHEPEFTLLEWYQLNLDHHGLMAEMDVFLQTMLGCPKMVKQTYAAAFETHVGVNPHENNLDGLKAAVNTHGLAGVLPESEQSCDPYLFLLMSHVVEPALAASSAPVAVYDFPASQAALARIIDGVAARFEVYFKGVELANGFFELQDEQEQQARFKADQATRTSLGLAAGEHDPHFLAALSAGLPMCSGVAVGVDRLFALSQGHQSLSEGLAFAHGSQ